MSGYFSTYGPPWLNPTQLVWPFCREASRLCSWLKGRVVRDGAGCESCKGRLQAEREEVTHAEPAAQLATPEGTGGLCETFVVEETMSLEVQTRRGL